ncbi:MAG: energy transducer TonB [Cyclobacteriaceae bacterium]|nr:energy transducer TonB [Cyclobacteriaceae bacterium]
MEAKKYKRADINQYRFIFFNIGLIISLGLTYTAFEWKFYDDGVVESTMISADSFDEIVEIPPTEQPPPPPPELRNVTIIEIEDVSEIEDELEVSFDIEMTEDMSVEALPETLDIEEEDEEEVSDEVFLIVEQQPSPKGGINTFYKYINSNLRYPSQAQRMRIQGRVFVQFVIEKDGSISQVEVIRGIDSSCNQEAIRVVSGAPDWQPGKQRGKPVRVKMVIPISFRLK